MNDSPSRLRLKAVLNKKAEKLHKKVEEACDLLSAIQNGHEVEYLPKGSTVRQPKLYEERYY